MKLPFYIVDVFAEEKYAGNQLAVFLNADGLNTDEMRKIARENNSAEIRIFTVENEMRFAGHPIIGTSWVLMNKIVESQPRNFKLSVPIGEIPIQQYGDLVWLQAAQPQFWS